MSRRLSFFSVLFGSAAMIFLSQSLEYAGAEYMELAGFLALGGGLGTITSLILAARIFKHVGDGDIVLAMCCCAGLPFAVGWLLSINGTQVNVHGFAILGLIFYALGCWTCVNCIADRYDRSCQEASDGLNADRVNRRARMCGNCAGNCSFGHLH